MDVLFPPRRRIPEDVPRAQKNLRPFDSVKNLTEQCGSSALTEMVTKAGFCWGEKGSEMRQLLGSYFAQPLPFPVKR